MKALVFIEPSSDYFKLIEYAQSLFQEVCFFTIGSQNMVWPQISSPIIRVSKEDSSYHPFYFTQILSDLYDQEKPDLFLALDHSSNRDFVPGVALSKQATFFSDITEIKLKKNHSPSCFPNSKTSTLCRKNCLWRKRFRRSKKF